MKVRRGCALATIAVLAFALAAVAAVPVRAHGGDRAIDTVAGPYRIAATVSSVDGRVDETVLVTDGASGEAVERLRVLLTLERGDERRGPFVAAPVAGSYEARYPPPDGGGWRVRIEVAGPAGSVSVVHPFRAPGGGLSGPPALALNLALAILLAAAVLVLPRLGGTRRQNREATGG